MPLSEFDHAEKGDALYGKICSTPLYFRVKVDGLLQLLQDLCWFMCFLLIGKQSSFTLYIHIVFGIADIENCFSVLYPKLCLYLVILVFFQSCFDIQV